MEARHPKSLDDFERLSLFKSFRADGNAAIQISNLRLASPP